MLFKKRFGRATWQTINDVRKGLLTRQEGFELIKRHDSERPEALDYYLKITGLDESEFYKIMNDQKVEKLKDYKLPIKKKKLKIKREFIHLLSK